jgi:hypothetical protein
MDSDVAGMAESQAVVNVESQIGMRCPRLDVMGAELVMPSGADAALLTRVGVTGKDAPPPLVQFGGAFSIRGTTFTPVSSCPVGIVRASHPCAAASTRPFRPTHDDVLARSGAKTSGASDRWRVMLNGSAVLTGNGDAGITLGPGSDQAPLTDKVVMLALRGAKRARANQMRRDLKSTAALSTACLNAQQRTRFAGAGLALAEALGAACLARSSGVRIAKRAPANRACRHEMTVGKSRPHAAILP